MDSTNLQLFRRCFVTPYQILRKWDLPFWVRLIGFLKDTRYVEYINKTAKLDNIFYSNLFQNKTLSAITQAGLVNNLNDGMIWGLLPIVLLTMNYDSQNIGIIAAIPHCM
jgi:hypothetical protein